MITIPGPAKASTVQRSADNSSAGILDQFPPELLRVVFGYLDLRSIARLSQVSIRSRTIVQAFPPYQHLLKYAPSAMTALARTGCMRDHSIKTLHTTLYAESCVSCGFFGAYLFLPTCEPCCYECLRKNHALWVVSPAEAQECFGLDDHHFAQLPVMRNIPGVYGLETDERKDSHTQPGNFTSVKLAKTLAIEIHGSIANLPDWTPSPQGSLRDSLESFYLGFIQGAPLEHLECDPIMIPKRLSHLIEKHSGIASTPMPSVLPDGQLDSGLWCRGCQWSCARLLAGDEHDAERLLGYIPNEYCNLQAVCSSVENRARSRKQFVEHCQTCHGVSNLAREKGWGATEQVAADDGRKVALASDSSHSLTATTPSHERELLDTGRPLVELTLWICGDR